MRILILGGTVFLGRHIVDAALERGHEVTLFNRGQTKPELFPDVEKLRGDRDGDLAELEGKSFDAVIDTSGYLPRVVRATLDALGEVGHYTFVSTISVYGDMTTGPNEETPVATLEEETEDVGEHYGALKALCEDEVRKDFPDAFVVRPGLIVGPWDPTGRFTYWPMRMAAGGSVLAPSPPDALVQTIDARDLAAWIVDGAERNLAGTFNAVGPTQTIESLLDACKAAAESDAYLVWVDPGFLAEHEVGQWMELPLWLIEDGFQGMLDADGSRAAAAGLSPRPIEETARDTHEWARSPDAPIEPPAGLAREKEQAILEAWLERQPA